MNTAPTHFPNPLHPTFLHTIQGQEHKLTFNPDLALRMGKVKACNHKLLALVRPCPKNKRAFYLEVYSNGWPFSGPVYLAA